MRLTRLLLGVGTLLFCVLLCFLLLNVLYGGDRGSVYIAVPVVSRGAEVTQLSDLKGVCPTTLCCDWNQVTVANSWRLAVTCNLHPVEY